MLQMCQVRPAEGLFFPLFGYGQYRIGDANTCVCATEDPLVLGRCIVSDETCGTWVPQNDSECGMLTEACSRRYYSREDLHSVLRCLRRNGQGSDAHGLSWYTRC